MKELTNTHTNILAVLDELEGRGQITESELAVLAADHELEEDELAELRAELEARDVEIEEPETEPEASARSTDGRPGPLVTDSLTLFM